MQNLLPKLLKIQKYRKKKIRDEIKADHIKS